MRGKKSSEYIDLYGQNAIKFELAMFLTSDFIKSNISVQLLRRINARNGKGSINNFIGPNDRSFKLSNDIHYLCRLMRYFGPISVKCSASL